METVHLKQYQVAARWNLSEATLERWRSEGIGPKFLKFGGLVRYREVDIEAFELSCLATSTQSRGLQTTLLPAQTRKGQDGEAAAIPQARD